LTEALATTIRPGRDADSDEIIHLIGACWSEYPDIVMDVDREMPELRALATYYQRKGGALWVAEAADRIVGMIAVRPDGDGVWEICRVYVLPNLHGGGLGHRLLDIAEAHARLAGAATLELWTDTRFRRAHRFYEKRGYQQAGPTRALNDLSESMEFHYVRSISQPHRARHL
jgi:GNAT superfamily N-acetyltransferase